MAKKKMYFPQEEFEARWKKLGAAMKAKGYETAIVWGKSAGTFERTMDVAYLTNFFSTHSGQEPDSPLFSARSFEAAIVEPGKPPELHTDEADPRMELLATDNYYWHFHVIEGIAKALKTRKIRGKVAWVGSDVLPVKYAEQLRALTPGIEYVYEDNLVRDLRRIKSPRELNLFREGGEIASAALTKLIKTLITGKHTEGEAAAAAITELVTRGAWLQRVSISTGADSYHHESSPLHGFTHDHTPKVGDLAHSFVYGPIYQGYWIDPGRAYVIGRKPKPEQKKLVEDCVRVMEEGIEAVVKHGVKVKDVARNAKRIHNMVKTDESVIDTAWPYYGHSNGSLWEHPLIAEDAVTDSDIFEEGMVASSEVFMTRKGVGCVMMETNWIVTKTGIEKITPLPMYWW